MNPSSARDRHDAHHVRSRCNALLQPPASDLIRVGSRRWFLQTGLAGLCGLSLPEILRRQARAAEQGMPTRKTSVILIWLGGGPSHLDTWDLKPDAPREIRGPFQSIPTNVPGIRICEHLPLQARIMDKLTLIRSVDCSTSNHTSCTMQAGNALSRRKDDGSELGGGYPAMGSIAAKFRGPNDADLPAFVGLADLWSPHQTVWGAGHMGSAYEPVNGGELAGRLALPGSISVSRLQERDQLRRQFDRLRRDLEAGGNMARMDRYARQSLDMVLSGKAQKAFEVALEPDRLRDAYGRHSLGEKTLLARRLVEAGVTFVVVCPTNGDFDNHGDHIPGLRGIDKGLKPLLPPVDRVLYTLVNDLEARGLLDTTLVLMLGEFGRTPVVNENGGRDHWIECMSMVVAGGGLRSGQVIGSTDSRGYHIKDGRVAPADLAATVFRHLGIDLGAHWQNPQGRPIPIVTDNGRPIPQLLPTTTAWRGRPSPSPETMARPGRR